MIAKGKLSLVVCSVAAGLLVWSLLGVGLSADSKPSDAVKSVTHPVKYVYYIDYPRGRKAEYIAWVKSVVPALTGPSQVKRINSYDNYYTASPHRIVEFEFESMADAAAYFEDKKVRAVIEDLSNHGVNVKLQVYVLRSDYAR